MIYWLFHKFADNLAPQNLYLVQNSRESVIWLLDKEDDYTAAGRKQVWARYALLLYELTILDL